MVRTLLASILLMLACSCEYSEFKNEMSSLRKSQEEQVDKIAKAESEIARLNSELTQAKNRLSGLSKEFGSASLLSNLLGDFHSRFPSYCDVNLKNKNFNIISSKYGILIVSCQDVTPYRDGSRVLLHIGNTTNATLSSVTIDATWGPEEDFLNAEWHRQLKEHSFTLSKDVLPGRWSVVELNLNGFPPDKLQYLNIRIQAPSVSLLKPLLDAHKN